MLESRLCRVLVGLSVRHQSTAPSAVPKQPSAPEPTGIHFLEPKYSSPFGLFKEWYKEHQVPNKVVTNALTFSTSNKAGQLSSRTLILRRLDENGFVIMTDKRSRKSKDLEENPQVRAEGSVQQLATTEMEELYEVEPLFCKIRAHICHQGRPVDWRQHKENHDKLLTQWEQGRHRLDRPDHVVAYKLVPQGVEFYESQGMVIADRLLYKKSNSESGWDITRIAA